MSVLTCRICGSTGRLLRTEPLPKGKMIFLECVNCGHHWENKVQKSWDYNSCLYSTRVVAKTDKSGEENKESAFAMLLRQALEKTN